MSRDLEDYVIDSAHDIERGFVWPEEETQKAAECIHTKIKQEKESDWDSFEALFDEYLARVLLSQPGKVLDSSFRASILEEVKDAYEGTYRLFLIGKFDPGHT